MSCDVVLVHPERQLSTYQGLSASLTAIEHSPWCLMAAGYLQAKGWQVAVIDMAAEHLSVEDVAAKVQEIQPRLAVLVVMAHQPSASTHNMTVAGEVVRAIDRPIKTLMMGGHPSALPERTLREEECDYVAIGEGPVSIDAYLRGVHAKGLAYFGMEYVQNAPAPLLTDLDAAIPTLPWELMPPDRYRNYNWASFGHPSRTPYASFYTSLGCPFACEFCAVQSPFYAGQAIGPNPTRNSYRLFSPAWVGRQLEHLVKTYGVKHVRLADEMFLLYPGHVGGICDEIIQRGLDLNLYVYARADTCGNKPLLEKMRKAGFGWVCLGLESSSQAIRSSVGKTYSDDTVAQAIKNLEEAGINLLANYMVGLPHDTLDSMEATLQEAIRVNAPFFNLYATTAYPGSKLYQEAVAQGLPLPDKWENFSQHSQGFLPLPTETLTSREIVQFRDSAFVRYFSRAAYLDMILSRFGKDALLEVEKMLAVRLERSHA